MKIDAKNLLFDGLNQTIRDSGDRDISLTGVMGQRYIGAGLGDKVIDIEGVPGNALGAYLNGCTIRVHGNAQDATGDTMNGGEIIIHGSSGDATGYAMRGGKIFIEGSAGYRAGIHMKAYKENKPAIVIGGKAGEFLGEYQAGGLIVVLGLGIDGVPVGGFCGTGMHGGKIYLRSDRLPLDLPKQVNATEATDEEMKEIESLIGEFCGHFGISSECVYSKKFFCLTPNTKNPYKQLYTYN